MSINSHVDAFMEQFDHEGLTFDDVSLITQYADFLPENADLGSHLTSRIPVAMPFLSAAMDTVTESGMAIAMAMLGGIGIIHKNLSPEIQSKNVDTVKHHLNGLINDPIVFHTGDTLATVRERSHRKAFSFSGFPILNADEQLVGILTGTDIRFSEDPDAKVTDVMTSDVITAEPETTLSQAYEIMMRIKKGKLPLVDNGKLVGLYSFSDVKAIIENVAPEYSRDSRYRLRAGAAVSQNDNERAERLADVNVDVI